MKLGERIKLLRNKKGLTQEELGKAIGSTKQNIYKYENGIITNIPSDKLEEIAKCLDTSPAYLMGWAEDNNSVGISAKGEITSPLFKVEYKKTIPILGRVPAGDPCYASEYIEGYEKVEDDSIDYGLIVRGDSMMPLIHEGSTVYVVQDSVIDNGNIVIALVNGDEATIKRFYKYGDEVFLRPENTKYQEQHYRADEVTILGKVKNSEVSCVR